MNSFQRSRALFRASRKVLRLNPSIAYYPIFYILTFALVNALVIGPIGYFNLFGIANFMGSTDTSQFPLAALPFLILLYIVQTWVFVYFNAACYLAADAALNGKKMSIRRSLVLAWKARASLAKWSFFTGIIGAGLRYLEDKLNIFGKVIVGSIGATISVASIFAVPVLVNKNSGPIDTLRQSASLLKKSWGENVVFVVGIGLYSLFALIIFLFIPNILAVYLILVYFSQPWVLATSVSIMVVSVLVTISVLFYLTALETIFKAALYRYAESSDYVGPYDHDLIASAFTAKKNKVIQTAAV